MYLGKANQYIGLLCCDNSNPCCGDLGPVRGRPDRAPTWSNAIAISSPQRGGAVNLAPESRASMEVLIHVSLDILNVVKQY